jgi:hypothetical protein
MIGAERFLSVEVVARRREPEESPLFLAPSFAGRHAQNKKRRATPALLSTSNLYQPRGLAARPGGIENLEALLHIVAKILEDDDVRTNWTLWDPKEDCSVLILRSTDG